MSNTTLKYVFIHIPKTAGSSVNKTLSQLLGPGLEHVESKIDKSDFVSNLEKCNWISGHVTLRKFNEVLPKRFEYKFLTFIREPTLQLISHLKWQFAIYDKGRRFFTSHPRHHQIIALDAISLDYYNPDAVIDFLLKNRGLFLNFQSNYILANIHRGRLDGKILLEDLDRFDFVCTTDNIYRLLPSFLNSGEHINEERENKNDLKYFHENIFKCDKLQDFLLENNARDTLLYNIVKKQNSHILGLK